MSALSSIGSLGVDPLQFLRQVTETGSASGSEKAGQAPPNGGEPPPQLWEDVEESASTAGLSEEEIASLKTEVKDAIAAAFESADLSTDPESGREAVDEAILATLQEHGIDTEELETKMSEAKSQMQEMGPPPGPPPGQGAGQGSYSSGTSLESGLLSTISGLSSESDAAASVLSALFPLVDEEA